MGHQKSPITRCYCNFPHKYVTYGPPNVALSANSKTLAIDKMKLTDASNVPAIQRRPIAWRQSFFFFHPNRQQLRGFSARHYYWVFLRTHCGWAIIIG